MVTMWEDSCNVSTWYQYKDHVVLDLDLLHQGTPKEFPWWTTQILRTTWDDWQWNQPYMICLDVFKAIRILPLKSTIFHHYLGESDVFWRILSKSKYLYIYMICLLCRDIYYINCSSFQPLSNPSSACSPSNFLVNFPAPRRPFVESSSWNSWFFKERPFPSDPFTIQMEVTSPPKRSLKRTWELPFPSRLYFFSYLEFPCPFNQRCVFSLSKHTWKACFLKRHPSENISWSIHVWYIYLHYHKNQLNEGKYTIHGWYGYPDTDVPFHPLPPQQFPTQQ